jgi:ABC-type polysaccharide/polyol phosphate export permease
MILETLFLTGLALFLSAASVRSRDIPYLTGLALTVWFFMTPIVWPEDRVNNHQAIFGLKLPFRTLLLLNPMARFSIVYRNILWDIRSPGLTTVGVLAAVSAIVFMAGYRFFTRRARYFAEEL